MLEPLLAPASPLTGPLEQHAATTAATFRSEYSVGRRVGRGKFGEVLVACHRDSGLELALKRMHFGGAQQPARTVVEGEITALMRLDHPNVVRHVASWWASDHCCLLMELSKEGDLAVLLARRFEAIAESGSSSLPEEEVAAHFVQLSDGLAHIHAQRVLHRDLKPENVLCFDGGRRLKICDFGVAKCLGSSLELARTTLGSPVYMAPELFQGDPYGYKADVWSLGVLLYKMATNTYPFTAQALPELASKVKTGAFAPLSSAYSAGLHHLAAIMLQFHPSDRAGMHTVNRAARVLAHHATATEASAPSPSLIPRPRPIVTSPRTSRSISSAAPSPLHLADSPDMATGSSPRRRDPPTTHPSPRTSPGPSPGRPSPRPGHQEEPGTPSQVLPSPASVPPRSSESSGRSCPASVAHPRVVQPKKRSPPAKGLARTGRKPKASPPTLKASPPTAKASPPTAKASPPTAKASPPTAKDSPPTAKASPRTPGRTTRHQPSRRQRVATAPTPAPSAGNVELPSSAVTAPRRIPSSDVGPSKRQQSPTARAAARPPARGSSSEIYSRGADGAGDASDEADSADGARLSADGAASSGAEAWRDRPIVRYLQDNQALQHSAEGQSLLRRLGAAMDSVGDMAAPRIVGCAAEAIVSPAAAFFEKAAVGDAAAGGSAAVVTPEHRDRFDRGAPAMAGPAEVATSPRSSQRWSGSGTRIPSQVADMAAAVLSAAPVLSRRDSPTPLSLSLRGMSAWLPLATSVASAPPCVPTAPCLAPHPLPPPPSPPSQPMALPPTPVAFQPVPPLTVTAPPSPSALTELLIFACSPTRSELPACGSEAVEVAMAASWAAGTHISYGGDVESLRAYLAAHRTKRFLFSGHTDLELPAASPPSATVGGPVPNGSLAGSPIIVGASPLSRRELCLAFTKPGGAVEAIEPALCAEILGSHAVGNGGSLELVMLNGCRSAVLGEAVRAAGVATVVCWSTRVLDAGARVFARVFFQRVAAGSRPQDAFEEAKRAVRCCTKQRDGLAVQLFELADPDAAPVPGQPPPAANGGRTPSGKLAVGLPILLDASGDVA